MELNANRNHKDSVFSKLFSTPQILRELYSAIQGIDIPQDAIIDINTISDVLFMKQINDLSFTINDRVVVLIEHQSTINENVPLRLLMYIGRVYEKITDKERTYQRKLEKIPTPEFIVLYNGKEDFPDHKELRLSAAFKDISEVKLSENDNFPLELIVQVYNINHGRNMEMQKKSETLKGYSFLIEKIKEYNEKFSLDEALRDAVRYCIEQNVLKEFLEEHGSEVINMLFEEFSVEEIAAIRAKEAWEDGLERGREEGIFEGKRMSARNLLEKGSEFDYVSEITGLSLEEIEKL